MSFDEPVAIHRRERRSGPRRAATKEAPEEELGRFRETWQKVFWSPTKTGTDEL